MSIVDRVSDIVVPLLEPLGLELYDVETTAARCGSR